MTTDTWVPAQATPDVIAPLALEKMIAAGHNDKPNITILADGTIDTCRYLMQKDLPFWQKNTESLNETDMIALIRFFTVAEEADTRWHGGETSPVIYINKILRKRGHKLDKNLLLWIKANSSNQFLPNGPITL